MHTSTGKQSVNKDKNHEKQIAGRSTFKPTRCACSFGMSSSTESDKTIGHARETSRDGEKKLSGRRHSMMADKTQKASSSFPYTRRSVDVTRFMP